MITQHFDNYELQKELGRGATAKIYLAQHSQTKDHVSLKIFHPKMFQDPEFSQRIQREIQVSTSLRHRNIVKVREVLKNSDPPALVMDYVDGENLEVFQARLPYVLPEISVLIIIEILKALEYAHGEGLIHRDLKPENVLIRKDGRVFVTDFGLAKVQEMSMITQANVIVGSIDYMSPEQARGENLTPTSDLFSVGTILYFMVTGTRPFSRSTLVATLNAIREETPESPEQRNPKLSVELCRLICRALDKNPENRYKDATEFRQALTAYLNNLGLSEEQFNLKQWVKEPTAVQNEALQTAAAKLSERCYKHLKEKKWVPFHECLSHLNIKAPSSAAMANLSSEYKKAKENPWKKRALAIGVGCLTVGVLIAGGVYQFTRPTIRHHSGHAVLAEAAFPIAMGVVKFNVSPDITVFWDGRPVDPSKPHSTEVGTHEMLLTRPGFAPIKTKVNVLLTEPAMVNVK